MIDAAALSCPVPEFAVSELSDFLCIWNTNFQTLQAAKEMAGKLYGQVGAWAAYSKIPTQTVFFVSLFVFCQGSLSFQLLGADGGLYVFGRSLCLLSTVMGLTVPSHNYTAVYNPRPAAYVYFLFLDINSICRFLFSCFFLSFSDVALEFFKQAVYSPWQSPLCRTVCLSQILPGLGSGETKAGQDRG